MFDAGEEPEIARCRSVSRVDEDTVVFFFKPAFPLMALSSCTPLCSSSHLVKTPRKEDFQNCYRKEPEQWDKHL